MSLQYYASLYNCALHALLAMKRRVFTLLWLRDKQPADRGCRQESTQNRLQNCHTRTRRDETGDDGEEAPAHLCKHEDKRQRCWLNSR